MSFTSEVVANEQFDRRSKDVRSSSKCSADTCADSVRKEIVFIPDNKLCAEEQHINTNFNSSKFARKRERYLPDDGKVIETDNVCSKLENNSPGNCFHNNLCESNTDTEDSSWEEDENENPLRVELGSRMNLYKAMHEGEMQYSKIEECSNGDIEKNERDEYDLINKKYVGALTVSVAPLGNNYNIVAETNKNVEDTAVTESPFITSEPSTERSSSLDYELPAVRDYMRCNNYNKNSTVNQPNVNNYLKYEENPEIKYEKNDTNVSEQYVDAQRVIRRRISGENSAFTNDIITKDNQKLLTNTDNAEISCQDRETADAIECAVILNNTEETRLTRNASNECGGDDDINNSRAKVSTDTHKFQNENGGLEESRSNNFLNIHSNTQTGNKSNEEYKFNSDNNDDVFCNTTSNGYVVRATEKTNDNNNRELIEKRLQKREAEVRAVLTEQVSQNKLTESEVGKEHGSKK